MGVFLGLAILTPRWMQYVLDETRPPRIGHEGEAHLYGKLLCGLRPDTLDFIVWGRSSPCCGGK